MGFVIAIEGNIGAGKTALMTQLAQGVAKKNFKVRTMYGEFFMYCFYLS